MKPRPPTRARSALRTLRGATPSTTPCATTASFCARITANEVQGSQLLWEHLYLLDAAGHETRERSANRFPLTATQERRGAAERRLREGDLDAAREDAFAALRGELECDSARSIVTTLELLARIETARGGFDDAARLIGACDAFRTARASLRPPILTRLLDAARERIEDGVGAAAFAVALAEGATLELRAAASYAQRARGARTQALIGWDALTPMERQVAERVAEGQHQPPGGNGPVDLTETVKTHLSRVFTKLQVANRKKLMLYVAGRRAGE